MSWLPSRRLTVCYLEWCKVVVVGGVRLNAEDAVAAETTTQFDKRATLRCYHGNYL